MGGLAVMKLAHRDEPFFKGYAEFLDLEGKYVLGDGILVYTKEKG
ncbi:MAG: hypothetical protein Q8930_16240 [Bacillota bacterium]|nr:hypothetical protein [Bacillota bacterium]